MLKSKAVENSKEKTDWRKLLRLEKISIVIENSNFIRENLINFPVYRSVLSSYSARNIHRYILCTFRVMAYSMFIDEFMPINNSVINPVYASLLYMKYELKLEYWMVGFSILILQRFH